MYRLILVLLGWMSFISISCGAVPVDAGFVSQVASNSTWRQLLMLDENHPQAPDDFYLTKNSYSDENEVRLSIDQMNADDQYAERFGLMDEHFACKYPARYFFIKKLSGLPFDNLYRCASLNKWINLRGVNSASLVLVGSYLSNPASGFGHTLLRIEYENEYGIKNLMGFNFGALIPEYDGPFAYILKGIGGGYDAAYSDQEAFILDQTYNNIENRDSWIYEIELKKDDLMLIALHLRELMRVKFKYRFLNKNCGWMMAKTLSLSFDGDRNLNKRSTLWYLPVDLPIYLQDAGLVRKMTYQPSHEKKLNHSLSMLPDLDLVKFYKYASKGNIPDEKDSNLVVDALIDFYNWKNPDNKNKTDEDKLYMTRREDLVKIRLQRVPNLQPDPLKGVMSPSMGNRPVKSSIIMGAYPRLNFVGYSQNDVDRHYLGRGNMSFADVDVGLVDQSHVLQKFRLLNIEQVNDPYSLIPNGSWFSWFIDARFDRDDYRLPMKHRSSGGIGITAIDVDAFRLSAYQGFVFNGSKIKNQTTLTIQGRGDHQWSIKLVQGGIQKIEYQRDFLTDYFAGFLVTKNKKFNFTIGRYW